MSKSPGGSQNMARLKLNIINIPKMGLNKLNMPNISPIYIFRPTRKRGSKCRVELLSTIER